MRVSESDSRSESKSGSEYPGRGQGRSPGRSPSPGQSPGPYAASSELRRVLDAWSAGEPGSPAAGAGTPADLPAVVASSTNAIAETTTRVDRTCGV